MVSWPHQQGTTRAGSSKVTSILTWMGDSTQEPGPASIKQFLTILKPSLRNMKMFKILNLHFQHLEAMIFLLCSAWSVSRSRWEGHALDKTWIQEHDLKRPMHLWAPFPNCSNFASLKNYIHLGKIFCLKICLEVDTKLFCRRFGLLTFFKTNLIHTEQRLTHT